MQEITKSQADAINSELKKTAIARCKNAEEYAGQLWKLSNLFIKTKNKPISIYEYFGYKTFGDYVKLELHMDPRVAHRYIDVYQTYFVDLADVFDKSIIKDFDILYRIIHLVTEDNVNDILLKVSKMKASELSAFTKADDDLISITYNVRRSYKNREKRILSNPIYIGKNRGEIIIALAEKGLKHAEN